MCPVCRLGGTGLDFVGSIQQQKVEQASIRFCSLLLGVLYSEILLLPNLEIVMTRSVGLPGSSVPP